MKNIYISAVLILGLIIVLKAQQNTTFYYMHQVPQSHFINPSIQSECKLNLGGLALPIAGQILPPIQETFGTNGPAFNQILPYDESIDSLITPLHPNFDSEQFYKRLKKVNYIMNETQISLLNAGYKWKDKFYFSFSLTERVDFNVSYPEHLILLTENGNGKHFISTNMDMTGLGFSAMWYREWALGGSMKVNEKLTIGARAKLLFGKMDIWTKSSSIKWYTDDLSYDYTHNIDYEIVSTQPFYSITQLEYDKENDSLLFGVDTLVDPSEADYNQIIMNGKNPGFALDIGATYIYNNQITLYGSITDLGFIRWRDNAQSITISGNNFFDGLDIAYYLQNDDSVNEARMKELLDSTIKNFDTKIHHKNYTKYLNSSIYLGGTYQLTDKYNVGVLYRGTLLQHRYLSSLTLSGNGNIKKWFSATISYSIINNNYANVGAGWILKAGPAQFYMVTDNIGGIIWPQSSKTFNLRMGINLLFGCNQKSSQTMK